MPTGYSKLDAYLDDSMLLPITTKPAFTISVKSWSVNELVIHLPHEVIILKLLATKCRLFDSLNPITVVEKSEHVYSQEHSCRTCDGDYQEPGVG